MNQEQTRITTGEQVRPSRNNWNDTGRIAGIEFPAGISNWREMLRTRFAALKKICFLFHNMDDFAKEVLAKMETYEICRETSL